MTLTPKQENFCLTYLETGNATKAYRQAYNAAHMKPTSVNRNAFRLVNCVKIRARIDELRGPVVLEAQISLENHLEELAHLRDRAKENGNLNAAIRAEELRGRVAGLYETKLRVAAQVQKVEDLTTEELLRIARGDY